MVITGCLLRCDLHGVSLLKASLEVKAPWCKENGPLAHLVWVLVFEDQPDQIGLMNL
jgi:hypothetical protein